MCFVLLKLEQFVFRLEIEFVNLFADFRDAPTLGDAFRLAAVGALIARGGSPNKWEENSRVRSVRPAFKF